MKTIVVFLFISLSAFAEEWILLGPDSIKVYDYIGIPEDALCTENGLLIDSSGVWKNYSVGLPVLDVYQHKPDTLLVVLSNGSWSDGLYSFNLQTRTFDVIFYCGFPRFIYYEPTLSTFYLGTLQGCYFSDDCVNWTDIAAFRDLECYSMTSWQGNRVISTSDGIYYQTAPSSLPFQRSEASINVTTLTHDGSGNIYGVYPGSSRSSGIWLSTDFGETWTNEFYEMWLSEVYYNGDLIVGWEERNGDHFGAGIWDIWQNLLMMINRGLPNARVNRFSTNQWINCLNIICCTDSGAYFSCNFYPSDLYIPADETSTSDMILTKCSPNPFCSTATISYTIPCASRVKLEIYALDGKRIKTLTDRIQSAGEHSVIWDATDNNNKPVTPGIYLYKIDTNGIQSTERIVLIGTR